MHPKPSSPTRPCPLVCELVREASQNRINCSLFLRFIGCAGTQRPLFLTILLESEPAEKPDCSGVGPAEHFGFGRQGLAAHELRQAGVALVRRRMASAIGGGLVNGVGATTARSGQDRPLIPRLLGVGNLACSSVVPGGARTHPPRPRAIAMLGPTLRVRPRDRLLSIEHSVRREGCKVWRSQHNRARTVKSTRSQPASPHGTTLSVPRDRRLLAQFPADALVTARRAARASSKRGCARSWPACRRDQPCGASRCLSCSPRADILTFGCQLTPTFFVPRPTLDQMAPSLVT